MILASEGLKDVLAAVALGIGGGVTVVLHPVLWVQLAPAGAGATLALPGITVPVLVTPGGEVDEIDLHSGSGPSVTLQVVPPGLGPAAVETYLQLRRDGMTFALAHDAALALER